MIFVRLMMNIEQAVSGSEGISFSMFMFLWTEEQACVVTQGQEIICVQPGRTTTFVPCDKLDWKKMLPDSSPLRPFHIWGSKKTG